jgi:hypothetical protein
MLAEEIEQRMSASEFFEWLEFFKRRADRQEGKQGNLLKMKPGDMVAAFNK